MSGDGLSAQTKTDIHGILNIISWLILIPISIYFAVLRRIDTQHQTDSSSAPTATNSAELSPKAKSYMFYHKLINATVIVLTYIAVAMHWTTDHSSHAHGDEGHGGGGHHAPAGGGGAMAPAQADNHDHGGHDHLVRNLASHAGAGGGHHGSGGGHDDGHSLHFHKVVGYSVLVLASIQPVLWIVFRNDGGKEFENTNHTKHLNDTHAPLSTLRKIHIINGLLLSVLSVLATITGSFYYKKIFGSDSGSTFYIIVTLVLGFISLIFTWGIGVFTKGKTIEYLTKGGNTINTTSTNLSTFETEMVGGGGRTESRRNSGVSEGPKIDNEDKNTNV